MTAQPESPKRRPMFMIPDEEGGTPIAAFIAFAYPYGTPPRYMNSRN